MLSGVIDFNGAVFYVSHLILISLGYTLVCYTILFVSDPRGPSIKPGNQWKAIILRRSVVYISYITSACRIGICL